MSLISTADRYATAVRWVAIALIVVSTLSVLQLVPMAELIDASRERVASLGLWGPVAFGALYIAATVLLLPGAILTLGAGALFGPILGTATVSVASVSGAALAFLIARYFARARVERLLGDFPKFEAIDRAIGEGGWKIVGMLRLSPAIPFNLSNYLYGLTSIRFWPCVLTSWVAMAPGTFMYVYLGYLAAAGVESAVGSSSAATELGQWALRIVGLAATLGVTVYITRIARRAIAEQTDIETTEERAADGADASQTGGAGSAQVADALAPPVAAGWTWRTTWLLLIACLALGIAIYARSEYSPSEHTPSDGAAPTAAAYELEKRDPSPPPIGSPPR
jgi:uncharacterized membrane protein YdjX (TVP38/TMEM64 family)